MRLLLALLIMGKFFGASAEFGSSGFFNQPSPNYQFQPLLPVDAGNAAAVSFVDLHQIVISDDGTHALAVGVSAGNIVVLRSSDSGLTWSAPVIVTAFPFFVGSNRPMAMHGTTVVLCDQNGLIWTSTDGGATWANTTAVGMIASNTVYYSKTAGKFIVFDTAAALVWTSAAGLVWNSTATPTVQSSDGFESFADNAAGTAVVVYLQDNGGNTLLWSSIDGDTWVQRLAVAGAGAVAQSQIAFDAGRNQFITSFVTAATSAFYIGNAAGTVWTAVANQPASPIGFDPIVFDHDYFTFVSNSQAAEFFASGDGGLTWVTLPIPTEFVTGTTPLVSGTGIGMIIYGPNVAITPDGIHFGPLLEFPAGATGVTGMDSSPAAGGFSLACGNDAANAGHIWRVGL